VPAVMAAAANASALPLRDHPVELAGHVFGRFTVLALCVLIGVAAWFRQPVIVTLLGLTLATAGVSHVWSRLCLRRVRCERTLSTNALFPGEQLVVTTRLSNQKLLPLPWIDVAQPAPPRLLGRAGSDSAVALSRSLSMPWYSRLTWREPIVPERRGYYTLPPLTLTSGDILGFYPRATDAGSFEHVSVYPRLYPVRRLPLQRADANGALTGRVSLQEDPTRMRGIRDYQHRDGIRRVHWKASAHHQRLMVKLYEPPALARVSLVLVGDSFDEFTDDNSFELATSAIASIACHCVESQMQVGFLGNSRLLAAGGRARLAPGGGNVQLVALLELLARITTGVDVPFGHLADGIQRLAASGAGLIIVTGRMREEHVNAFTLLSGRRCPLLVLEVGAASPHGALPFRHRVISTPADLADLGDAL